MYTWYNHQKNGSLDAPLDISNQIRVNAGENFIISVTPGTDTAKANNPKAKRFIIESVVSQEGATITKENGNENKAKVSETAVKGSYVVDPTSATTEFESVGNIEEQGYNLRVNGLAAGTYYLVETQAPEGFNKLTDPIKVTITKDDDTNWTVKKNDTAEDDKIIDVENSSGSLLPSTGGRGAIAFAVIAAILVFGVAVSFIRDKRKQA